MIMVVPAAPGWSLDPGASISTAVRMTQGAFAEMARPKINRSVAFDPVLQG